ncbi:FadR/GntR family transcriptional regulator [soil metagenome]
MDSSAVLKEAIIENMRAGLWRAGHRISTERELSEQFDVGRSGVRRVLAQLKQGGFIRQTVGSGTYVSDDVASALARIGVVAPTLATSPAELMEARLALEPSIIEMVIRNATPADFDRMDECCDQGEAAATLEAFEHWDGALHESIAAAAHNAFVTNVFKLMNAARAQGEWGMLKRQSVTAERRVAYQHEHRALVAALRDRDLTRAIDRAREHLIHVRRNLLGA